jgi:hypothetical protein
MRINFENFKIFLIITRVKFFFKNFLTIALAILLAKTAKAEAEDTSRYYYILLHMRVRK